jgi:hypothetical protein
MADFKDIVIERDINPYQSFLSSFFAGFAELGLINQGSMNIVSKRAAEYLYNYFDAKGILADLQTQEDICSEDSIRYHIDFINSKLNLIGSYTLEKINQDEYIFRVAGNECRICPKGVGGAAIKGTFCPIPSFYKNMVNLLIGKEIIKLQSSGIEKQGTTCNAVFMLSEE